MEELGRHPLYVKAVKSVKYWLKLVELAYGRLPKAAYETLKITDKRGTSTWVTEIRTTLFSFDFWNCIGLTGSTQPSQIQTRIQTATCRLFISRMARHDLY